MQKNKKILMLEVLPVIALNLFGKAFDFVPNSRFNAITIRYNVAPFMSRDMRFPTM